MAYTCWDCNGSGEKEIYKVRKIYDGVCFTCKGTGKTKIYNPDGMTQSLQQRHAAQKAIKSKLSAMYNHIKQQELDWNLLMKEVKRGLEANAPDISLINEASERLQQIAAYKVEFNTLQAKLDEKIYMI